MAEMASLRDSAFNNDQMLRKLCASARIDVGALNLRTLAPPVSAEPGLGTPASSVAGNISTVSSPSLSFDRMELESPTTQTMGPPVAGPSGTSNNPPKVQGMFVRLLDVLQC